MLTIKLQDCAFCAIYYKGGLDTNVRAVIMAGIFLSNVWQNMLINIARV